MYFYLQQLFDLLNTRDNHILIMAVYLGLHALVILLRIICCLAYRSVLFSFRLNAKDLKSRDDIKKIRNGLLRRLAAEYIRVADKSVSRIPASSLVDQQVSGFSLLGWKYVSLMPFVETVENSLLFIGLILAFVFNEYTFMYGVLAVAGFVLVKLVGAFFDFRDAKKQLTDELLIYTEREIGHYYAADAGGAVLRMKNELSDAIAKQSLVLKEAIDKIGDRLAETVDKKLIDMNTHFQQSAQDWEKTLLEAGRVQGIMNASAEKMQVSGLNIQSASDLLAKHLQSYSDALSQQLTGLVSAVESVKESNTQAAAGQEAYLRQAQYIERNQQTLEHTFQSYETALQSMTQSIGDGLGAYLKLNAQSASQSINETLAQNINAITLSNRETLQRMAAMFDQMRDQSKDVSAHLLSVHEKLAALEQTAKKDNRHG